MSLNTFVIMGLRGEINDSKKLLIDLLPKDIVLPEGSWVAEKDVIFDINNENINWIEIENLDNLLKTTLNDNIYIYSNKANDYKKYYNRIECMCVILLNKMYNNCTDLIDMDEFNNRFELVEDSGWHDSTIGKFKLMKYKKI